MVDPCDNSTVYDSLSAFLYLLVFSCYLIHLANMYYLKD